MVSICQNTLPTIITLSWGTRERRDVRGLFCSCSLEQHLNLGIGASCWGNGCKCVYWRAEPVEFGCFHLGAICQMAATVEERVRATSQMDIFLVPTVLSNSHHFVVSSS